ncbi:MAG TPA: DUF3617 family protein [Bauldia sp.]
MTVITGEAVAPKLVPCQNNHWDGDEEKVSPMRTVAIVTWLLAVCVAVPAAADQINLPARKPGQWKIEMVRGGAPVMTMQLCLDAASDKAMMESGLAITSDKCGNVSTSQNSGTITIDAECKFGPMTTHSHTVISGDFESAYTIDTVSDSTGGSALIPKHSEIKQNVTWAGPCNGMKPGEMMMPGGMKINPLKVLKPGG